MAPDQQVNTDQEDLGALYPEKPDWKEIREEDRQDIKLWFRIGTVGVIGLAALFFALVPQGVLGTPWDARSQAWTLLGVIVGNLIKGVLD